jgi:hypothetical protein
MKIYFRVIQIFSLIMMLSFCIKIFANYSDLTQTSQSFTANPDISSINFEHKTGVNGMIASEEHFCGIFLSEDFQFAAHILAIRKVTNGQETWVFQLKKNYGTGGLISISNDKLQLKYAFNTEYNKINKIERGSSGAYFDDNEYINVIPKSVSTVYDLQINFMMYSSGPSDYIVHYKAFLFKDSAKTEFKQTSFINDTEKSDSKLNSIYLAKNRGDSDAGFLISFNKFHPQYKTGHERELPLIRIGTFANGIQKDGIVIIEKFDRHLFGYKMIQAIFANGNPSGSGSMNNWELEDIDDSSYYKGIIKSNFIQRKQIESPAGFINGLDFEFENYNFNGYNRDGKKCLSCSTVSYGKPDCNRIRI